MGRINRTQLKPITRENLERDLWRTLTYFKTEKAARRFWGQCLTPSEVVILSKRLAVFRGLLDRRSYGDIMSQLKVGSSTLSRAKNTLRKNGDWFADLIFKLTHHKPTYGE